MNFRTKRTLSLVVVCVYLFLGGVEFAVIFPTAWEYLQTLGVQEEYLLGITVAGYSASAAVTGVIGGRWSDSHPHSTKKLSLLCISVMVLGNLQYTLGYSVWNVVASRFVCGVGTGAGAALLAYVCRTTTNSERTAVLSVCNACRQIGILVGPAFQFFLTFINVQIGPVQVTRLNAAGLFMAVLWVMFIALCLSFFTDLTSEWQDMQLHKHNMCGPPRDKPVLPTDSSRHRLPSTGSSTALSLCESISIAPPESAHIASSHSQELLQDTVISLMGTVFTIFFGQILVETIIPVYMKQYFDMGDIATSYMYMAGGVECLLLLLLLVWLSTKMADWTLHLTGLLLVVAGFAWLCLSVPTFTPGDSSNLVSFVIGCFIVGAGYPITSVANASLISKALSVETQGIGQGIRRLASYLGLVLGPMWAGAAARRPLLLMGVTLALVVLQLLMFLDTLPRVIKMERAASEKYDAKEDTPLLNPTQNKMLSPTWPSCDSQEVFPAEN